MLCAMGILLALIERNNSGKGQVVDAAMVDGAANLSVLFFGLLANHLMTLDIGTNMLDSGFLADRWRFEARALPLDRRTS